jgi:hypothetical protein
MLNLLQLFSFLDYEVFLEGDWHPKPRSKQAQQVVLGAFMGKCNRVGSPKNAPLQIIAKGPVSPLIGGTTP